MRLTQHLAAQQICLGRARVLFFLVMGVGRVEGSLGVVLRKPPMGGPVTPVVRGGIIGRGQVAGLGAPVATPMVSQHLWSTHVALILALYKHKEEVMTTHHEMYKELQTFVPLDKSFICYLHWYHERLK